MTIKAHAKVNIFLKITGHQDGYHTLLSRFVRVENLYDTITFEAGEFEQFTIEGCDGVDRKINTIYQAFIALNRYLNNPILIHFFMNHKVVVSKQIPTQAGLGGGSSDAAAFMRLVNEVCKLDIDTETLAAIGSEVGADLPFFIYNYPSANVKGFGEIVTPFDEEPLSLELHTPDIACDTTVVYKVFKKYLLERIDPASFFGWENLDSRTLLNTIVDPVVINDLYPAAMVAYPEIEKLNKKGWFFSGSGSTFFRLST
ncbi:MAG: 4-(cytidine 5'-diphospho)-2-C-methyl-D-erythritol kinase [Sulfurovum sp.]|nr:4-(cytidine 5'-diphospho)-2-C-methyl-D-erythritol kinase [Sulfurovum sp.]